MTFVSGLYFLKLVTRTGQIWQIQYAVLGANGVIASPSPSQTAINPTPLADGTVLGRFSLNPDSNGMLILLDEIGGGVWLLGPTRPGGGLYSFTKLPDPS
jgi:hypothetical protein